MAKYIHTRELFINFIGQTETTEVWFVEDGEIDECLEAFFHGEIWSHIDRCGIERHYDLSKVYRISVAPRFAHREELLAKEQ